MYPNHHGNWCIVEHSGVILILGLWCVALKTERREMEGGGVARMVVFPVLNLDHLSQPVVVITALSSLC